MASFTAAQQAQIRMYLGYPDLYRYEDPRLEGILQGDQVSPEAVAIVAATLVQLQANDAQVYGQNGAVGIVGTLAGFSGVGKGAAEFYEGRAINDMRAIRRELATRISNTLGVPFYSDAFGEGGYAGDDYDSTGGGRSAGNVIPLG